MDSLTGVLWARIVAEARTVPFTRLWKTSSGSDTRHTCGTWRQDGETKPAVSRAFVPCSGCDYILVFVLWKSPKLRQFRRFCTEPAIGLEPMTC
jgi:hypothetical protein